MSESIPPKLSVDGDGLLKRLTGKKRLSKSAVKTIPVDREERFAKWWEMRLMGATITEIVKHELNVNQKTYSEKQISAGLDTYAMKCLDESGRKRRMSQHRAFVDRLRQIAMGQVQNLRVKQKESEGKGLAIHTEEAHYDDRKRLVSTKSKVTYEPIDKSMIPWLKFAIELDKYAATIDGLMGDLQQETDLNVIDINIEGFLGIEEDTDGGGS